jgi:hypothetical protein
MDKLLKILRRRQKMITKNKYFNMAEVSRMIKEQINGNVIIIKNKTIYTVHIINNGFKNFKFDISLKTILESNYDSYLISKKIIDVYKNYVNNSVFKNNEKRGK